jgi:hypothetical protein
MECRLPSFGGEKKHSVCACETKNWACTIHTMLGYSRARVFNCSNSFVVKVTMNESYFYICIHIFSELHFILFCWIMRVHFVTARVKMLYHTNCENALPKRLPATVMPKYFHHRHGISFDVLTEIIHEQKVLWDNFDSPQSNSNTMKNHKKHLLGALTKCKREVNFDCHHGDRSELKLLQHYMKRI